MRYAQVVAAALADLLKNYIEPNENPGSYLEAVPLVGAFLANQYNAATTSIIATFGNPDLKEGKLKSAKGFFSTLKYEFPRLSLNDQNPHEFPENTREELSVFLEAQLEKERKLKLEAEKLLAKNDHPSKLNVVANTKKPAPATKVQEKFSDSYLNKLLTELTSNNTQSQIAFSDEYLLKLLQALIREELAKINRLEETHQKEQATYDSILMLCQKILEELEKKNLGEYLELYHQSAAGLHKKDPQAFMIENFLNQHLIAQLRYWPYQIHTLTTPKFSDQIRQLISASGIDKQMNGDTVKALNLFSELMEKRLIQIKGEFCKDHRHCVMLLKASLFRILEIEKETGASLKAFSDPLKTVLETVKVMKPVSAISSASATGIDGVSSLRPAIITASSAATASNSSAIAIVAASAAVATVFAAKTVTAENASAQTEDKKTKSDNPADMSVLTPGTTILKCDSLIPLIEIICTTEKYRLVSYGFGPTVAKNYGIINSDNDAWLTDYPSVAAVVLSRMRTLKFINEKKLKNQPCELVETDIHNIINQEKSRIAQLRQTREIHQGPYDWVLDCCSHIIQDLQPLDQYADVFLQAKNTNLQIRIFMQTLIRQYAALRVDFRSSDLVDKGVAVYPDNIVKPSLSRVAMNTVSEILLECLQDTSKELSETETLMIIIESTLHDLKEIPQKQTSQLLNDIVCEFERRLASIRNNMRFAEMARLGTKQNPTSKRAIAQNAAANFASSTSNQNKTTENSQASAKPIAFSANHPSNKSSSTPQADVEIEGQPSPTAATTTAAALPKSNSNAFSN